MLSNILSIFFTHTLKKMSFRIPPSLLFISTSIAGIYIPYLCKYFSSFLSPSIKPVNTIDHKHEQAKTKFHAFCESTDKNNNIDPIFYNKLELQQHFTDRDNQLEPYWNKNILFQTTPRGNVIMTYDPYKLGFSYYCDNKILPYTILNTMAMKYVCTFHCIDFFMDNNILETQSILWDIHFNDKSSDDNHTTDDDIDLAPNCNRNTNDLKNALKTAPFLRSKKKNTETKQKKPPSKLTKKQQDQWYLNEDEKNELIKQEETRTRNKFIYLGKISHFPFLQKNTTKPATVKFSSAFTHTLNNEHELQTTTFDYKHYKQMIDNKKTT